VLRIAVHAVRKKLYFAEEANGVDVLIALLLMRLKPCVISFVNNSRFCLSAVSGLYA